MKQVAVIDYGMGNLHSVARALSSVADDVQVQVTQDPKTVAAADRIVFPGQGAIGVCRRELERLDLMPVLIDAAASKPFLGMCLGPQFLMERSEEDGGVTGLGVFRGEARRFPSSMTDAEGRRCKVPHMGWNRVHRTQAHALWAGIPQDAWFYFVHSYYLAPAQADAVSATTEHGIEFASALAEDNVFAVQFHPEKSAKDGLRLLENFLRWDPA